MSFVDFIVFLDLGHLRLCDISIGIQTDLGVWIPTVSFTIFANPLYLFMRYISKQIMLEIFEFTLLLINALSLPRKEGQPLLNILYRDGIIFFSVSL